MRSSRAAVDLIVSHEVTSKAVYEKKYRRPELPGAASGITVGIGYDLGYNKRETILNDWSNYLPPDVIRAMQECSGLTQAAARQKLAYARQHIDVPWDAAMAVFMGVSLPKFEAITLRAVPGSDKLPAGCFGVLSSITYNRGASYSKDGDRYKEMRNIRTLVSAGRFDEVPAEIRAMKRIWAGKKGVEGLLRRRDEEAALWEQSLRAAPVRAPEEGTARVDTGDDKDFVGDDVTSEGNEHLNVQPEHAGYSIEVETIQKQLTDMKYFEVGKIDGRAGGKFVAGVAAFMTDRGKDPNKGRITPELKHELEAAKAEKWSRPIAPSRANATAKDIAPEVAAVNVNWYQKISAFVLGIPAAVGAGLKTLFGEDTTSGYIHQIKDILAQVPTEFYLLALVVIAGAIFLAAKKSTDSIVADYNKGKIN